MTWKHVILVTLGSALGFIGAVFPGAAVVTIPLASAIIGGALGHMAPHTEPTNTGTPLVK